MDIKGEANENLFQTVAKWELGFVAYEKKDFKIAADIFAEISRLSESDLVAKKYFDRCSKYITSPPCDKSWDDGVDNLSDK